MGKFSAACGEKYYLCAWHKANIFISLIMYHYCYIKLFVLQSIDELFLVIQ